MLYNVHTQKQFDYLLRYQMPKLFSSASHPIYCGWKGPGVYSMEEVFFNEVGMVFKRPLQDKPATVAPVKPVQLELDL